MTMIIRFETKWRGLEHHPKESGLCSVVNDTSSDVFKMGLGVIDLFLEDDSGISMKAGEER